MRDSLPWIGRVLGALGVVAGLIFAMLQMLSLMAGFSPSWVMFVGIGSIVLLAVWIYLDWDPIVRVVSRRGTIGQLVSWLLVLLVGGILVLANFMSSRHYWEKDITEGSIHSLSDQAVDVLTALDQPVTITGFYRQMDSSGDAVRQRDTFRKLTERLQVHSELLTVELIDQDIEPRVAMDRSVFQNGVVFIECGEREERIILPDENDLTNALIKATRDDRKTIYFLAGHGEHTIHGMESDGYGDLRERLSQSGFELQELELFKTGIVPEDADALVIAGPTAPLLPAEVERIREFVEVRGGGLMVLLNPGTESGLDGLLAAWGIELGRNLVVDVDPMRLTLVGDYTTIFAEPGFHEITRELEVPAILGGTRTVRPATEGEHGAELLRTGKAAWGETDLDSLEAAYDAEVDELGPLSVGAVVEVPRVVGSPVATGDDDSADGDAEDAHAGHDHGADDEGQRAPVIVFGDSDFAANGSFSLFGNSDLVLNSVSFMVHEEDLITIRARDEEDRPLMMTGLQVALVMVIAVPGVTLLVIGAGIVAWIRRMAR
jgi:hypothetical protein